MNETQHTESGSSPPSRRVNLLECTADHIRPIDLPALEKQSHDALDEAAACARSDRPTRTITIAFPGHDRGKPVDARFPRQRIARLWLGKGRAVTLDDAAYVHDGDQDERTPFMRRRP